MNKGKLKFDYTLEEKDGQEYYDKIQFQFTILTQDAKIKPFNGSLLFKCKNGWTIRKSACPEISCGFKEKNIYIKGDDLRASCDGCLTLEEYTECKKALEEFKNVYCGHEQNNTNYHRHALTSMFKY